MLLGSIEIWQHALAWRVTTAVQAFPITPVDLSIKVVGDHPDAPYFWMIAIGAAITAITGFSLLVLARRQPTIKNQILANAI